jgi:hypothetical protein
MSSSPSRKRSRQCVHFDGGSLTLKWVFQYGKQYYAHKFTFSFQLSSAHTMSCDLDNQHDTDCKWVVVGWKSNSETNRTSFKLING